MDKRVESLQADCLDGGSTPPSSTNRERENRRFSLSLFVAVSYWFSAIRVLESVDVRR